MHFILQTIKSSYNMKHAIMYFQVFINKIS